MLYLGVLFLLILTYLRPQEFITIIQGWPIVFWTMVVLALPWLATLSYRKLLRTRIDLFMFLLWLIAVISWWNYWKSHMHSPAKEFGRVLLIYLFVAHAIDSRAKLTGVVWMTLLGLLIVGMMGGRDVGLKDQYASIGLFNNRNDFAYALAMLFPLGLAFFLKGDPFAKIIGAGACIVAIAQTIMSDSRGGQLAMIIAGGAVFYALAKTPLTRKIMLILGIASLFFAIFASARLESVGDYKQDASAMGRVEMWANALIVSPLPWDPGQYREFFRRPMYGLIGCGFKQFKNNPFIRFRRDTHNSYMRALTELGGIGLFIYVGLLWFAARDSHRMALHAIHPTTRVMALALFGVTIGQVAAGLFQTRVYHIVVLAQFAIISAMQLVDQRDRYELETANDVPGSQSIEDCRLWIDSFGSGFRTPNLVTKRDLKIIFGLTLLLWAAHKAFVMRSN
jgi:putative inorganic carbon (hco3(-)) transporter